MVNMDHSNVTAQPIHESLCTLYQSPVHAACPTCIETANINPNGTVKLVTTSCITLWCAASAVVLNAPINQALALNKLLSRPSVPADGRPIFNKDGNG